MCMFYYYTYSCNHTDRSKIERCPVARVHSVPCDACSPTSRTLDFSLEYTCRGCAARHATNRATRAREAAAAEVQRLQDEAAQKAYTEWDPAEGRWGRRRDTIAERAEEKRRLESLTRGLERQTLRARELMAEQREEEEVKEREKEWRRRRRSGSDVEAERFGEGSAVRAKEEEAEAETKASLPIDIPFRAKPKSEKMRVSTNDRPEGARKSKGSGSGK